MRGFLKLPLLDVMRDLYNAPSPTLQAEDCLEKTAQTMRLLSRRPAEEPPLPPAHRHPLPGPLHSRRWR